MRRASPGLRARLLLLVLVAVLPAFGLLGYSAIAQRRRAARDAQGRAMNLVRLAGATQGRLIASTRQILGALSHGAALQRPATPACSRRLAALRRSFPYYTNLGVATPTGQVVCSARPLLHPVNVADRGYFRHALFRRAFSIGDYQVGRITGVRALNFGEPVLDARGRVRAVVFAALDLSWFDRLARTVTLPPGSTLTVLDNTGTILARHPGAGDWVGRAAAHTPLARNVLRRGTGVAELPGLDGAPRLYAYAPLPGSDAGHVYVSVGIPTAVAYAKANRELARDLGWLLAVAGLALLAAWVGGEVLVLRRVRSLVGAARRLGAGELGARTGLAPGRDELGRLASAFDTMAASLERATRALRTLSAGNRALVRATEEAALLEAFCRIIVEVGGYAGAWVGYAEPDAPKTIRPVAQAGVEGGLAALTGLGITWADAPPGRGPAGRAIRTGRPVLAQDILAEPDFAPWRAEMRRRGYAGAAAFPLHGRDRVLGVLVIYAREAQAFDVQERAQLGEAAEDLAFGITALRTRAEHEQAHETIRRMAYYDGLTGLPNHVYFEERLQQALAEAGARGKPVALLMLDLERFGEINDALGFRAGDQVLQEVGARLRAGAAEGDLVARMRGDEFALALPARNADAARTAAARLLETLHGSIAVQGLALDVSAAIGIALFPSHGAQAARLIRHADVAMRQAKKRGAHYALYEPGRDEDSPRRLALAAQLRHAIEADELVLHYQPKVDVRTGRVCGAEALVRWLHPQEGMIPPDEFIPLAEHTGLIKPLTDWVVQAVVHQACAWRRAGPGLPLAANLSARNLQDAELLDRIERLLAAQGAGAGCLELEITESAIMDDPEAALEVLTRLDDLGIALFIDDFGTGYSSLAYLKKLPVQAVKIDQSFVADMLADADSASIVRATIALAHDLGLKVVAEGVEDRATWERLAAWGCDVVQGYYVSPPLPAERFTHWLSESPWGRAGGGHGDGAGA